MPPDAAYAAQYKLLSSFTNSLSAKAVPNMLSSVLTDVMQMLPSAVNTHTESNKYQYMFVENLYITWGYPRYPQPSRPGWGGYLSYCPPTHYPGLRWGTPPPSKLGWGGTHGTPTNHPDLGWCTPSPSRPGMGTLHHQT